MKIISILFCLVAFQLSAMAQKINESKVPVAVKDNLNEMFKNPTVTKWEMEEGSYEASFVYNGVETAALFTPEGKFLAYEYAITSSELPVAATNYISTNLPGKKMEESTRIKSAAGLVSYEVQVGGKDYIFDTNGNFIEIEEKHDKDVHDEK